MYLSMQMHWSNAHGIVQCSMTRATLEASGCRHWATSTLLRIAPVADRATINKTTMKNYAHFAGHFNGHCDAVVQYRTHHPMEKVQGFTRSH
jgi:hypothetical protein